MTNLYEEYRESWDKLAAQGKPSLGEMAKHFMFARDMDRVLGLNGSVHNWAKGKNSASAPSEAAAREWLENRGKAPAPAPVQPKGHVLMVVCGDSVTMDRATKVLNLLGCEVVEV
jgi:hypothetical protein